MIRVICSTTAKEHALSMNANVIHAITQMQSNPISVTKCVHYMTKLKKS